MIIFLISVFLLVYVLEELSVRYALQGVRVDYYPSSKVVEPGAHFEIITNISNSSRRFIPFLRIDQYLPEGMTVYADGVVTGSGAANVLYHTATVYLLPGKALKRQLPVSIEKRGRYILRGAKLRGGDLLGLSENGHTENMLREVVVLPKEAETTHLVDTLGGFLGDISVRRFIMEDPVLTAGYREYTGREPMKSISWTQSAKSGTLMVKQYDYTTELSVTVFLNIECPPGTDGALVEQCFSLARTVCRMLEEKKVQYDFVTNAAAAGAFSLWSTIGEGLGNRHFYTILEGLGRATLKCREPFINTVGKAVKAGQVSKSAIVITPVADILGAGIKKALQEHYMGGLHMVTACEEVLS